MPLHDKSTPWLRLYAFSVVLNKFLLVIVGGVSVLARCSCVRYSTLPLHFAPSFGTSITSGTPISQPLHRRFVAVDNAMPRILTSPCACHFDEFIVFAYVSSSCWYKRTSFIVLWLSPATFFASKLAFRPRFTIAWFSKIIDLIELAIVLTKIYFICL